MSHSPMLASLCLVALASAALAQDAGVPASGADLPIEGGETTASDDASNAGDVAATLALQALKPVLDEDGQPVLDETGEPLEEFQPVAEGTALLPGDEIRYLVALDNEGAAVEELALALDLPAEASLLPETVTASVEAAFDLGSSADPALREPLFVEIEGTSVPNPAWAEAPERFDQLLATIERLAAGEAATVTYDLVVR